MQEGERKISAGLVLFNNDTKQLLMLLESLPLDILHMVVVDNSPSNKLKVIFQNKKNITYIFTGKNMGFGKGHNIAFEEVKDTSKFHFVLNPDVYFGETVISEIVNFMKGDQTIGVVGPKIFYPDGELQYSSRLLPTPFDLFIRRFSPVFYREKRDNRNELRFTNYEQIQDVPFLLGCFLAFRSDLFKKIGGFDDRFFMYLEDTDICRKVLATHRVVFNPNFIIYHAYARGSRRNLSLFKHHLRSAYLYFCKWGWIFDSERKKINKNTLTELNY
ncbi:glycosyltransferase [Marinilabilia sp.]|uniref:glycosyltransferase n=1 Tax=Marinilabilia sp. TaxID=2021252 RepID=UPI0025BE5BE1|nr:glycosyltransferase family 2 protein [Marinilabilia sp.]